MSNGFWVFGYGSLMWNPGFAYAERCTADLPGHRRSFCLASVRYRGTPEKPGLVLALEPHEGAHCRGVAFRVAEEAATEALEYLRAREMVTSSYLEQRLPLRLIDCGSEVEAICYVMDTAHDQYRGSLGLEERAEVIAHSHGPAGPNRDYLFNTLMHLRELDVAEPEIEELARRVEALPPLSFSRRR